jgi:hypothetical protein
MRVVQQLDEGRWREFVDRNPRGNIFHTPEMFQVFRRTKGCQPALWATVGDDDRVLALLLPVQITVLGGVLRHLTTRSVAYGSILHEPGHEGRNALALLLSAYNRAAGGRSLFTELRNLADLGDLQPVLQENGFAFEEHCNFLVDLTRPAQEIWDGIQANAQRNIKKARRVGVRVEEVQDPRDVPAAYDILREVYRRIQVPLPHQSLFQAAFEVMYPLGMFRILVSKMDDTNTGVLTLLLYKGVVYYWYTGTLREYASHRAGDLLVWQALETGSKAGCHTLDFGGGGKPGEEYGVRDFKAKFGGDLVSYGRNVAVHAPLRLQLSRVGFQLARRFL